jgi:hypothetical protein
MSTSSSAPVVPAKPVTPPPLLHDTQYNAEMKAYAECVRWFEVNTAEFFAGDLLSTILEYSNVCEPVKTLFKPLKASVLTVQGKLSNVRFEEKDLIYVARAIGRIKKIACNYGEIYNETYTKPVVKPKKTNRGRKPKVRKKNVRKKQGNGEHFNSQITFWVESDTNVKKQFLVKVFRPGVVEIPGGLLPDMSDVRSAVTVVANELSNCFAEDVQISELYSIMQNYKFETLDSTIRLNLRGLFKCANSIFENPKARGDMREVKYNVERYPGLIIKFATPIPRNISKKTTIKIFQSGKINIDGTISTECANKYYRWLNKFIFENYAKIVYVPRPIVDDSDSDSDSESDSEDEQKKADTAAAAKLKEAQDDEDLFEQH